MGALLSSADPALQARMLHGLRQSPDEAAMHGLLRAVVARTGAPPTTQPATTPAPKPEISGMGATVAVDRFVGAAKGVQKDWAGKTPDERAKVLADAANAELAKVDVPPCKFAVEDLGGGEAGRFRKAIWTLSFNRSAFAKATATDADAADLANTVYHEARHAEQWFRMARLDAMNGKSEADIAARGIPADIAKKAKAKPYTAGTPEAKEAEAWHESVYGTGRAHRQTVLTELPKLVEEFEKARAEEKRVNADATATQQAKDDAKQKREEAETKFRAMHAQYMALPEEADAWKVGDLVTERFKKAAAP